MMDRDWDATREEFFRYMVDRDVRKEADKIPAHKTTVWNLMSGRTKRPTKAIRRGIERLLENADDER